MDVDGNRRRFMQQLAALGTLAAAYPAAVLAERRAAQDAPATWRDADPWHTLAAVQEHLFPAGPDNPGAGDIQALQYLRNTIENPDADGADRDFIFNGVGWLNDLAQETHKQPFTVLDEVQRETLLRRIEQSRAGGNWLSLLLTYLLEALLADPVYGGNPDGIGWRWLEHQPGFPTPHADRTWYRLAARAQSRHKA